MGTEWLELIRTFVALTLTFILGEFTVVGVQLWLAGCNWRFSRHLCLGTLVLGLGSVPALIGALVLL